MKKRILSVVLSLAMVAAVAINPMISYATSEEAGAPSEMEIATYRDTKETGTDANGTEYSWYSKVPTAPEGYVFAGWYTTADLKTPIGEDVTSGTAWAKWVPKNVLSVKYQITNGTTTESASTALRLVTTVDSTYYKSVGFIFNMGDDDSKPAMTDTVYNTILGGGKTYYPNQSGFDAVSAYFMVHEITGMPNAVFGTDVVVKPVWVTLDGTKVVGVTNDVNVSEVATVNDFSEGITFENGTELKFFTETTSTHGDYCAPELVSYTGDMAGDSTYGEKGLVVTKQTSATANSNIRFYMDFGRAIPKNSVVTFDIYIQGEIVNTTSTNPKITLKKDGGSGWATAKKFRYTPNQWDEASFTLGADDANQVCLIIIELQQQFAGKEVKVYMDNFEIQTPYSAGVDFETKSQTAFLTEAGTGADKRSNPSRVLYSATGLNVSDTYGLYGVQCNVEAAGTYPAFYLNWGNGVVAAGDTVTFSVYVKAEGRETLKYRVDSKSWDANNTRTDDTVTKSTGDGWNVVNDWYDVTVSFNGEAPVKEWVIFNFSNCTDEVQKGDIQIYVDNFKVIKAN